MQRRREGWWDRECREKKKEVRRELRKWRGNKSRRGEYKRGEEGIQRDMRKEERGGEGEGDKGGGGSKDGEQSMGDS